MKTKNNENFDGGNKQIRGWKDVIPKSDISYHSVANKLREIVECECNDYVYYQYGDGIYIISFYIHKLRYDIMGFWNDDTFICTALTSYWNLEVAEPHYHFSLEAKKKISS